MWGEVGGGVVPDNTQLELLNRKIKKYLGDINEFRYYLCMIKSFKDKETETIFRRSFSRRLPNDIQKVAMRKLWMLDAATDLVSLRTPPSNHLEALHGDRQGQHSIRINKQWRVCFKWLDNNAYDVEIVDYH